MKTISTEYTWEEAEYRGEFCTVEFVLSICATPGRPARIHGLPEDCYPEDPGTLEVYDVVPVSVLSDLLPKGSKPRTIRPKSFTAEFWLHQFEKQVEPSDDFKEWAWEQVADEPEDDDR